MPSTGTSFGDVALVAGTELRRRTRSRAALLVAFVAPLATALVFGFLFRGIGSVDFTVAVVDEGGTAVTAEITAGLLGATDEGDEGGEGEDDEGGAVRFVAVPDRATVEGRLDGGSVDAAVVVVSPTRVESIALAERPVMVGVGESVAQVTASAIERQGAPPVNITTAPLGGRNLSSEAFFAASMAIVFLFFTTSSAAQSMLEDRRNGTLARMLAGPTTRLTIALGKVLAVGVVATASFLTVWLASSVLFGAPWGSPPLVVALIAATVVALCGVATFVVGLADTPRQAETYAGVVTFVLALAGGNFAGGTDTPEALKRLSRFTPNGWALDGFTSLSVDDVVASEFVLTLGVLVGFGVVFGGVGLARLARSPR